MTSFESVTPDGIHDPLYPPVHVWHYTYRIPDGHIVPNPPRATPTPPAPKAPPVTGRQYLAGGAVAVIVLTLLVIGVFW